MTEKEGEALAGGAQEAVVVEEVVEPSPEQVKLEAEAREMGWKPKDAWKGDLEGWRPADEFVKRGKEIIPILNARLREKDAALERQAKESADAIARVTNMSQKGMKMLRDQLEGRYDVAKEKAVEQGDTKTYRAVEQAKKDALKAFDTEVEQTKKVETDKKDQPAGNLSPRDQAAMDEWMTENLWYAEMRPNKVPKNPVLFAAANEAWDEIDQESPGMSLAEKLAAVKEKVTKEFPDRFGRSRSNGNGSPRVESANGRGPEGGTSDGPALWNKVPEEVRKTAAKDQIEVERVFDHLIGAKKGQPLTQPQLKAAREKYAELYFQN